MNISIFSYISSIKYCAFSRQDKLHLKINKSNNVFLIQNSNVGNNFKDCFVRYYYLIITSDIYKKRNTLCMIIT